MIDFHGTPTRSLFTKAVSREITVPFPRPALTANWARRNLCRPTRRIGVGGRCHPPRIHELRGRCLRRALYRYGGGHPGPAAGASGVVRRAYSRSIGATSEMWAFFRERRLME